jgi:hypothetical protein
MDETEQDLPDYSPDQNSDEQGQDYREPAYQVMPSPAPAAVPAPAPVIARSAAPAPMSPAPGASPVYSPEQQASAAFWRKMSYDLKDQPLAQAEQALSAALKFQAVRGYQKDLENGKSPSEALSRWAPMMFTAPKSSNLGNAAAMVRATRPPAPMVRSAGGQLFQVPPGGGAATALTPAPVRPPRTDPFALKAYELKLKQVEKLQGDLEAEAAGPGRAAIQKQIVNLQREAEALRAGAAPTAPATPAAVTPAGRGNEVVRLTKSGRKAVFDAGTKQFLRYAE